MLDESVMPCLMERCQHYRESQQNGQSSWQFPQDDLKIKCWRTNTLADAELAPWRES